MKQRATVKIMMSLAAVAMFVLTPSVCAATAQKPPAKKTSLSETELRTLAKTVPDVKNAGQLYSVALATSNDVARQQEYLKAAAAGLIACGKTDIYKKHVKGKLQNAAEFEDELKDDCKQCSGSGKNGRSCYVCSGKGRCSSCKGSGRAVSMGFDRPNMVKPCHKCGGCGYCPKCGGKGSVSGKCVVCSGTGKAFSRTIAERVFHDVCNAIADNMETELREKVEVKKHEHERIAAETGAKVEAEEHKRITAEHAFDKTCRLGKSEKHLAADRLSLFRNAEKQFAKRCEVNGEIALVEYNSVNYAIVKTTRGSDNFVVVSGGYNPHGYAYSFMIFPTADSRNRWYAAVVKCSEKIKSWIRISAENKVKQVSKEMPIYTVGGSDEVSAYVNGITRGNGAIELLRKAVREPVTLSTMQSTKQLVVFTGRVEAVDDEFKRYQITIQVSCGDAFRSEVFDAFGTLDEINAEIVEWLTFVNPRSLENARAAQSKKEDLFR